MLRLSLIEPSKCLPISIEEAKKHLNVEQSITDQDALIQMLIQSATLDAQSKTGRTFVDSTWEWIPESTVGDMKFPIIPVTQVTIFDEDVEDQEDPSAIVPPGAYKVFLPALAPQGSPLVGSLSPLTGFPQNPRIVLNAGYPVKTTVVDIAFPGNPVLVKDSIGYIDGIISLVFDRPIKGTATIENFKITLDGLPVIPEEVIIEDDIVKLKSSTWGLLDGMVPVVSYFGGFIYDKFDNYVDVLNDLILPTVDVTKNFIPPPPFLTKETFASLCPDPIKQWIMVRVGTMFQQRSEIALRAGKSNDGLFEHRFIDSLLDPYTIVRVA